MKNDITLTRNVDNKSLTITIALLTSISYHLTYSWRLTDYHVVSKG